MYIYTYNKSNHQAYNILFNKNLLNKYIFCLFLDKNKKYIICLMIAFA